jgi:hypothetical protein
MYMDRHLAEDNVLAVQMRRGNSAEEELGAVGVGACVGHRENACCAAATPRIKSDSTTHNNQTILLHVKSMTICMCVCVCVCVHRM